MPDPPIRLHLAVGRLSQGLVAPFALDIRVLAQDVPVWQAEFEQARNGFVEKNFHAVLRSLRRVVLENSRT